MVDVAKTLAERETQYGNYHTKAAVIQQLKSVMRSTPGWANLPYDMRESLELIATKIGRILHGNPNHHDSWHDIGGYAKLIADRLDKNNGCQMKPIAWLDL
jgi:hypothetical protein